MDALPEITGVKAAQHQHNDRQGWHQQLKNRDQTSKMRQNLN